MELQDEELIEHLLTLLINPAVDVNVSYFAGGILAHLASSVGPTWGLDAELHCTVLDKLVCVCACVVCLWAISCVVCLS